MSPALSTRLEFVDALLRRDKQQMTHPPTDRFKVGDIAHIYNQQRRRIRDKPLRRLTQNGIATMPMDRYPFPAVNPAMHYAHFLGKVMITNVFNIHPCEMPSDALTEWAEDDGFIDRGNLGFSAMELADTWFRAHYGDDWRQQYWTVIRWSGWLERYFKPDEVTKA